MYEIRINILYTLKRYIYASIIIIIIIIIII